MIIFSPIILLYYLIRRLFCKDDDKQEMILEKPSPILENNSEVKTEEIKNPETFINDRPKHGRNEIVKITNGQEVRNIKYKKAESLIETGEWKII